MGIQLKNIVPTPTFENGSTGGWTAVGGTLSISSDHSAFGTKCLKFTVTSSTTCYIKAPASPVRKGSTGWPVQAAGTAYVAQHAGNQYASSNVYLGVDLLDAGGTRLSQTYNAWHAVTSTMSRAASNFLYLSNASAVSIQPVIRWDFPRVGDSFYIDAVTFRQFGEGAYADTPYGAIANFPDIIGSRPSVGNVSFSWEGAPEASASIATSSAEVTVPSVLSRGQPAVVTGTGFTPGASVKLRVVTDELAPAMAQAGFATVTADGSGAFSYNWPAVTGDQGANYVAAQIEPASAGWGDISSLVTVKGAPIGDPLKNYLINPYLRSGNGTARYVFNNCPNPTPTVDLTGWNPVGAATVTRSTAAKIVGPSHGARVVSASAADGISLPGTDWDGGHTAYVRAVTACTLTIGVHGVNAPDASVEEVGWGDSGWGGTGFVYGETVTLEAGQTIRARLSASAGWPYPTPPYTVGMKITGTGTYDVDGVVSGIGVADGNDDAPGSVPFFCGDTPADSDSTYEWIGTPYASASAWRGTLPLGMYTLEDGTSDGSNGAGEETYSTGRLATLPGGESAVALRGAQWFYHDFPYFTNAAGGKTHADLGLTVGKSYMFSADMIMDYYIGTSGYAEDGSNGNATYLDSDTAQVQPHIIYPGRTRLHLPFNVDDATDELYLNTYWGWLRGEMKMTKLCLTETTIYYIASIPWISPAVLTDSGIVPGSTVMVSVTSRSPDVDTTIAFEALVDGDWTVVNSTVLVVDNWEMTEQFLVDVPEDATGMRLTATNPNNTWGFTVSDAPVDYFDGSTADGDGWSYSWEGEPDASPSLRSAGATGPTAQVHIGGTAKAVAEMRVAITGGTLIPVTEAGA